MSEATYLYGFVPSKGVGSGTGSGTGSGADSGSGSEVSPLLALPEDIGLLLHKSIGCLVGSPEPDDSRQLILHARVLAKALGQFSAVVPVRPMPPLAGAFPVFRLLVENHEAISLELRHLEGMVEICVEVDGPEKSRALSPPASGVEYLRRHLPGEGLVRLAGPAVRALDIRLSALARGRKPEYKGGRLLIAYLVERLRLAEAIAEFEQMSASLETGSVKLLGPWVPYSFAQLLLRSPNLHPATPDMPVRMFAAFEETRRG